MSASTLHRPAAAGLALLLAAVALLGIGAVAVARASERAHRAGCLQASPARAGGGAGDQRVCGDAARRAGHHLARRHQARRRHARGRHPHVGSAATGGAGAPRCESGSAPVLSGEALACADGSRPYCADGSRPAISGSAASCPAPGAETEEAAGGESLCAGGSACVPEGTGEGSEEACGGSGTPVLGAGGSYECANGSEPQCPAGSVLELTTDGSALYCDPEGQGGFPE